MSDEEEAEFANLLINVEAEENSYFRDFIQRLQSKDKVLNQKQHHRGDNTITHCPASTGAGKYTRARARPTFMFYQSALG